jgi:multisubunit Na+/H+ antiporter MnhC subunit
VLLVTPVTGTQAAVLLAAVALLGAFHVGQWAGARAAAATGDAPLLGRALRDLAGGRDPWTRALVLTALIAMTFALVAPFVSSIGRVASVLPLV